MSSIIAAKPHLKDGSVWRRRALVLGLLLIACFAFFGVAVWRYARVGSRHALVLSESSFDFGTVPHGGKVEHTITIVNKGAQTAEIKRVRTSCSCITAVASNGRVTPGAAVTVRLGLDARDQLGRVSGMCVISFVDPDVQPIAVKVRASVYSETVAFSRDHLWFHHVVRGTTAAKVIEITNGDIETAPWRVSGVRSSSMNLEAEYQGTSHQILCRLSPQTPLGLIREKVIVTITGPKGSSDVEIAVDGEVVEAVQAMPERLFLGSLMPGQVRRLSLKIVVPAECRVRIPPQAQGVAIKAETTSPLRFDVAMTAPARPGLFKGDLVFDTDWPGQPMLRVPYLGIVKD